MTHILKTVLLFIFSVILLGISFYGVVLYKSISTEPVGSLQIGTFNNGLSLYQANRRVYYVVSPYNDYFRSPKSRTTYISKEEINKKQITTSLDTKPWKAVSEALLGYFGPVSPSLEVYTKDSSRKITYTSKLSTNKIVITSRIETPEPVSATTQGITLSYTATDFIYDKTGELYESQSTEDITEFNSVYHTPLSFTNYDLYRAVPLKAVVVVNPHISGTMVVRASQNQRIFVNRNAKLIEVEQVIQPGKKQYDISISIEVYSSPQEAQTKL